jgi:hypothetical protein
MLILSKLLDGLKAIFASFPDKRKGGEVVYSMTDIAMAAFSLFFMQSESFLSHQRSLEDGEKTSNCQTLFDMEKIPTDNHIRSMLDQAPPELLQPAFDQTLAALRGGDGLKDFQRLGGRTLIAWDGTEYFCSQKLRCPHCQTRKRSNGKIEYYHSMLAATIVAPGLNKAVPLMPEFIVKQDGAEKQDCERNARERWLTLHWEHVKDLRPIFLGDDLFACQPVCEDVLARGADFIFTAKQESHKTLYDFMHGAPCQQLTITRKDEDRKKRTYRLRWFLAAPLRDGKDALNVNWLGVTVLDADGKVCYDGAFVTSLYITKENVFEIAACARARWKIENESFNVLKNNGYNLEHNFGHGKQYLAMLFATMNLLAFAMHTVLDCVEERWIKARNAKRVRRRFFDHIRTLTEYLVFADWDALMTTLITSKPPPKFQCEA